ncbi:GIY-YIG nuclease family protein [Embleya sp. NPDC020630]|uniref:GIY-YIG nuclease family protein n=1 Tax=unclassified Embleya TaxID=2699296 RepID=UPI0037B7A0F4
METWGFPESCRRPGNGRPAEEVIISDATGLCIAPRPDGGCRAPALPDAPVPLCAEHVAATCEFAHDGLPGDDEEETPSGRRPRRQPTEVTMLGEGLVYFVRTDRRIKIGFTTDLRRRLAQSAPGEVLHTEPGSIADERRLHAAFQDLRLRGEWFRADPRLLDHIATLKAKATA